MKHASRGRHGNAIVEFTLVGIPIIFVLISIFEISRGMWVYDTLAHAVKEGVRLAIVNGSSCSQIPTCDATTTVAAVAGRIRESGVGLSPDELEVTLVTLAPTSTGPVVVGTVECKPLSACLTRTDKWPPAGANRVKVNLVSVQGVYPFRSAIAMFWPGAGPGMTFGRVNLPAVSQEVIQF